MILTNDNRIEALKVLRFLDVEEDRLKYMIYCDECGWLHKFEGVLGGRDGWSSLWIDRGPDYDTYDIEFTELINVDGVDYRIYEGD